MWLGLQARQAVRPIFDTGSILLVDEDAAALNERRLFFNHVVVAACSAFYRLSMLRTVQDHLCNYKQSP